MSTLPALTLQDTSLRMPLCLKCHLDVSPMVQARIGYTFRVFAAIYGHSVVENDAPNQTISFTYGGSSSQARETGQIAIPARYRPWAPGNPPAPRKHRFADEDFCLFFGLDETSNQPDWLGEIFEWLSSSQEMNGTARDSVGRIPFSETAFARHRISPRRPHASMLMAWLASVLPDGRVRQPLRKPPCPVEGAEHLVICSHDIDYYYTDKASALVRLLKNLVIA